MSKKSNIRSIRFSDDVFKIIEDQEGETFTAKFESLVRTCMLELPRKEKELELYKQRIVEEKKNYEYVKKEVSKMRNTIRGLNFTLESMTRQINQAMDQAERNLGIE